MARAPGRKWFLATVTLGIWLAALTLFAVFLFTPFGETLRESIFYRDVTEAVVLTGNPQRQYAGSLEIEYIDIPDLPVDVPLSLCVLKKRHPRLPGKPYVCFARDEDGLRVRGPSFADVEAWMANTCGDDETLMHVHLDKGRALAIAARTFVFNANGASSITGACLYGIQDNRQEPPANLNDPDADE